MNRTPLIASLTLAAALALSACSRNEEKTPGEKVDAAIAKAEQKADEVKSDVRDANNHTAASAAQAQAEVNAAMNQAGAKIDAATDRAAAKVNDAAAKAGAAIDDAGITTSVNAALARDTELSALKINVDTKNGHVTLKGSAPTAVAKSRATTLAQGVNGVVAVDNQLSVK